MLFFQNILTNFITCVADPLNLLYTDYTNDLNECVGCVGRLQHRPIISQLNFYDPPAAKSEEKRMFSQAKLFMETPCKVASPQTSFGVRLHMAAGNQHKQLFSGFPTNACILRLRNS